MYTLGSEQTCFVSDKPLLTSSSDNTPSGFLKLSPEIRNKIYCLTLVTTSVTIIDDLPWMWEAEKKNHHSTRTSYKTMNAKVSYILWKAGSSWTRPTISMLALNRQTRAEAVPIFYGNNVISFVSRSALIPFLRDRSKLSLQSIRYLHIDFDINEHICPISRQVDWARAFTKLPKAKAGAFNPQKLTVNIRDHNHRYASQLDPDTPDTELQRWVREMAKYNTKLDMFGVTLNGRFREIVRSDYEVRMTNAIEDDLWDILAPKFLRKVRRESHDAQSLLKRRIRCEEIQWNFDITKTGFYESLAE